MRAREWFGSDLGGAVAERPAGNGSGPTSGRRFGSDRSKVTSFGRNRRGASEVLGAMFIFAILIAAIGVFQVTIVPQTNEEIEFHHSTQVRADMTDLRAAMVSTAADGGLRTVPVETGTSYPTRSVTINPSDPGGQLSTGSEVTGAIELQNVVATDPDAGDYWDGTATFDSRFVTYRPSYNYYDGAPVTRYEPTVVYSSFQSGDIVETPQSLVDGRTLNVVLVSGSLSLSGAATESVDVVPVSTSTESVTITDPGPLFVKTHLSESAWQKALSDEASASVASYTTNADAPNVVELQLDPGQWHLRASLVSLNDASATTSAAYVVVEGSTDRTLDPGGTTDVTIRVLDRYGNPVEGVTVHRDFGPDRATGDDGAVTYEYSLSPSDSTVDLRTWIGSAGSYAGATAAERASVTVSSTSPDTGEPDASIINPGSGLVFLNATESGNSYELSFENRNSPSGASKKVTEIRVNYYHVGPPGSGGSMRSRGTPAEWSSNVTAGRYGISGPFASTDGSFDVAPGAKFGLEISFYESSGTFDVESTDFYIIGVVFEDGSSRVYFIAAKR